MLKLWFRDIVFSFLSPDDPDHSFSKDDSLYIEWGDGFVVYCPRTNPNEDPEFVEGLLKYVQETLQKEAGSAEGALRQSYDPVVADNLREYHRNLFDKIEEIPPPKPDYPPWEPPPGFMI